MKNPRLLDLQIMKALSIRSGDVSYIKDALTRADIGSVSGLSSLNWKDMTRRDVWNSTKYLIDKGYVVRLEEKKDSPATTRDKVIYKLTEEGCNLLSACEYSLRFAGYLTSA